MIEYSFQKGSFTLLSDKKSYKEYAEAHAKKSNVPIDCLKAFIIGGIICCIAQAFFDFYTFLEISEDNTKILVSCILIVITAILTGLDVFDDIAKHAGAGTLVPITGFANAIVSQAITSRSEGFILGLGAKIFTIAGPVILYGTATSVLYGIIYWIVGLFIH